MDGIEARQREADHGEALRLVVVAPTFNNARTVRTVLDGVASRGLAIIACNDGSTDATAAILNEWAAGSNGGPRREVVTHDTNAGKAAAMRSGFARATELGFSHALTIDTDGQHDPADIGSLVIAAQANPDALILGTRPIDRACYPFRSRLGRALSNGLVWFIGGVHVADSQCGLRVYPLALVHELGAHTSRYAFETEVLARAGWANVGVVQVPIRCIYEVPGKRVTHFRPWRDSLSAAWMHSRLIARSLFFWPTRKAFAVDDSTETGTIIERGMRWMNPFRTWRRIRVDLAERERVASSVGVGLFIGVLPAFGLKTVICLIVARAMSLHPLVVMGASSLTTPPVGFVVWAASIIVGHLLLHGTVPTMSQYDLAHLGPATVFRNVALEWIVGAIVFGLGLSGSAWLFTRTMMRLWPMRSGAADELDAARLVQPAGSPEGT